MAIWTRRRRRLGRSQGPREAKKGKGKAWQLQQASLASRDSPPAMGAQDAGPLAAAEPAPSPPPPTAAVKAASVPRTCPPQQERFRSPRWQAGTPARPAEAAVGAPPGSDGAALRETGSSTEAQSPLTGAQENGPPGEEQAAAAAATGAHVPPGAGPFQRFSTGGAKCCEPDGGGPRWSGQLRGGSW